MIQSVAVNGHAAPLKVHIANGRTKNADEWAAEITDKLLSIAETVPQPLRDQAHAFRAEMFSVIRDNLELALEHERQWLLAGKR